MLTGEAFELDHVEAAAGHNQARLVAHRAGRAGDHGGDHVIDVALDVDAGLGLEFGLAVARNGNGQLQPLAQLGVHDRPDIGVGHDGRVGRDERQLGLQAGRKQRLHAAAAIRHQAGNQACHHHRAGTCHEITGFVCHARLPLWRL